MKRLKYYIALLTFFSLMLLSYISYAAEVDKHFVAINSQNQNQTIYSSVIAHIYLSCASCTNMTITTTVDNSECNTNGYHSYNTNNDDHVVCMHNHSDTSSKFGIAFGLIYYACSTPHDPKPYYLTTASSTVVTKQLTDPQEFSDSYCANHKGYFYFYRPAFLGNAPFPDIGEYRANVDINVSET